MDDYIFSLPSAIAALIATLVIWSYQPLLHKLEDDGYISERTYFVLRAKRQVYLLFLGAGLFWALSILAYSSSIDEDIRREAALQALRDTVSKIGETGFLEKCTFNGNMAPDNWIEADLHPCRTIGLYRVWNEPRFGKKGSSLPSKLVLGKVNPDQSVTQVAWLQMADRSTIKAFQCGRITSEADREELLVIDAELRKAAGLSTTQ